MPRAAFDDCQPAWCRRFVLAFGVATGVPAVLVLVAALTGWGLPFDGTLEGPRMPREGLARPDSHAWPALESSQRTFQGDREPEHRNASPKVLVAGLLAVLVLSAAYADRRTRALRIEPLAWAAALSAFVYGGWLVATMEQWAEATWYAQLEYIDPPAFARRARTIALCLVALGALAVARLLWCRRDGLGMALVGTVLPLHSIVLMDWIHFAPGHLVAPRGTLDVPLPTLKEGWVSKPDLAELARLQVVGSGSGARLTIDFAPARYDFDPPTYTGSLERDWRGALSSTLDRYGTSQPWVGWWRDRPPSIERSGEHPALLAIDRDLPFGRVAPLLRALAAEGVDVVRIDGEGLGTPGTRCRVSAFLGEIPRRTSEAFPPLAVLLRMEHGDVRLDADGVTYESLDELIAGARLCEYVERLTSSGRVRRIPKVHRLRDARDVALRVADDVPWQCVAQLVSELAVVALVPGDGADPPK